MRGQGTDVGADSDEDLLVFISWKEEHPDLAKSASGEFYERHHKYISGMIGRAFRKELGEHGVEDMVNETFLRIFDRAASYEACGAKDIDRQRRNVRAWMGTVAMNVCRDYFRHPDTRLTFVGDWHDEHEVHLRRVEDIPGSLSDDLKCVHAAMSQLNDKELSVIKVTMAYWKLESKNQRLPNDVADDLARSLDTTSENIRKIRERAMYKLRENIEACRKVRRGDGL